MNLNLQTPRKQGGYLNLIIGGASAVAGLISGSKASKRQRQARRAQQNINRLKNIQARREFKQAFAVSQAEQITRAIGSGQGLESSAVQARTQSATTQADVSLNELGVMQRLGGEASSALEAASKASFNSQVFGAIGSFAMSSGGSNLINKLLPDK